MESVPGQVELELPADCSICEHCKPFVYSRVPLIMTDACTNGKKECTFETLRVIDPVSQPKERYQTYRK